MFTIKLYHPAITKHEARLRGLTMHPVWIRYQRSENYPGCGMSFHAFPHNSNIKKHWIKAVQRENWKPSQHSRICSKHFQHEYFIEGRKRNTLHKDAIPTYFTNNMYIEKETSPESIFSVSPDRIIPDPDHVTTIIETKNATIDIGPSKSPIFIIKSPTGITSFDGKLAKIFLKQRERSAKLLKKLRMSQQMCKNLKSKVALLEDEIKQLKSHNLVTKSAPLMLTLSNDMYEKETLSVWVSRSH